MQASVQKIKNILSGAPATWIILTTILLGRAIQLIYFYNIMVDGMYQTVAMQNFVHGHGFSLGEVDINNFSKINYSLLNNWPPGYSLLLSPVYIITGHNYILSGIITDLLFALLLIYFSRKVLFLLNNPKWAVNIFTILTGSYLYWFYKICSSDASAIVFFLMGIYYCIQLISEKHVTPGSITGITLPLAAAGMIKYMFIPLSFIIPVYIYLASPKEKAIKQASLIICAILAFLFGLMLYWLGNESNSVAYISSTERGFFPENLLELWPVIPSSILNHSTLIETAGLKPQLSALVLAAYRFLSVTGLAILLIYLFRKSPDSEKNQLHHFLKISSFIILALTLELSVLSLFVGKEHILPGWEWTYIQEARYFGLANVLIHISVFSIAIANRKKFFLLSIILILAMIPDMLRGQLFIANRISHRKTETYNWQIELAIQKFADRIVRNAKLKNENNPLVVSGTSYYVNYRIALYAHIPALNNLNILTTEETAAKNKNATLILAIEKSKSDALTPIKEHWQIQFEGEQNGFYFYTANAK